MQIKILGTGCANCNTLEQRTKDAVAQLGLEASFEHVRDIAAIAGYGVMKTPGLVVDEALLLSGRVPTTAQLVELLRGR